MVPGPGNVSPFLVLGVGIGFVVVAIVVLKVHPFLSLILAAILVGLLSPKPLLESEFDRARQRLERELAGKLDPATLAERVEGARSQLEAGRKLPEAVLALELTAAGFGATAASIAIVIVLAAIIGQCLMESGAADRIVRKLVFVFGERKSDVALMGSGYLLSIPVFFDTVFFLLVPLARSLALRTSGRYALYVTAICGGAFSTHVLVPPTPGPLAMADTLGLDLGVAIVGGLLLGLAPAAVGLLFARAIDRKLPIPLRDASGSSREELEALARRPEAELPGLFVSLLPVVLPVALISGASIVEILAKDSDEWAAALPSVSFLGNKNSALLLASFIAAFTLLRQKNLTLAGLGRALEPAVSSAGVIILITSAGGAFGSMLSRIGVDDSLRELPQVGSGASYLVLAFAVASVLKVAQGSSTVAIITTSAVMAAILPPDLPYHVLYVFGAIGFGSGLVSWMNDSGFWVVGKMSGFTEKETFLTWSLVLVVVGFAGLVEVLLLSALFPLV
jgi:GntP family gluconate:H+ symporter